MFPPLRRDICGVGLASHMLPATRRLWETTIIAIISHPTLAFRSTIHDRTIYRGTFEIEDVLLLPQVDGFALACTREFIGRKFRKHHEYTQPFIYLGILTYSNVVDVNQTAEFIELTALG
jgi:hypothetical protein